MRIGELMNFLDAIAPIPPYKNEGINEKWGNAVSAGFVAVPNALIKYQSTLGISQNELTVILNLLLHWWYKSKLPFPSTRNIAERSGMEVRTVQRALRSLTAKKLVEKVKHGDRLVYDLEGLRVQLEMYSENDLWSITKRSHDSNVVEMETTPELT